MAASASLSVELWQKILRQAIYVDKLLDTDAFDGNFTPMNEPDEAAMEGYQAAEKDRVRLSLVCWSWKDYLQAFTQRYVRMEDVLDGIVQPQALKSAIRIDLQKKHTAYHFDRNSEYADFCHSTFEAQGLLDVEILDLGQEPIYMEGIAAVRHNFPRIKILLSPNGAYDGFLSHFIHDLPGVRTILAKGFYGKEEKIFSEGEKAPIISSSSITTLAFRARDAVREDPTGYQWYMPALRHLWVRGSSANADTEFITKVVPPILEALGRNLRTLHIICADDEGDLPTNLWELCPVVETLHTGFKPNNSPYFNHPLHTVYLATPSSWSNFELVSTWSNVRLITFGYVWDMITESVIGAARIWDAEFGPDGRVEDSSGMRVPSLGSVSPAENLVDMVKDLKVEEEQI